ncbi:uncharacterized protein PAE49_012386 isoform 1-T1 [Odontesthes bonariensis]
MLCRLYLAAIHFNENANRPQAQTADGVPLFKISFPKSKKGECTVKRQKTKPTFGNVDVLMDLIFHMRGSLNPVQCPSSSGYSARIRRTTQAGMTTLIRRPKKPQHHATNCL